jgi:hypothetical protein
MGKNQDPGSGINIPDPQHWFWGLLDPHQNVADPQNLAPESKAKLKFIMLL